MQEQFKQLAERFDALALRERVLVWGAALTVIIMLWYSTLMESVVIRYRSVNALIAASQSESAMDENGDPVNQLALASKLLEQLNTTKMLIRRYDLQLSTASSGLISSADMNEVIHELLRRHSAIKLVTLSNQPTRELPVPQVSVEAVEGAEPLAQNSGVFMHPVQITIEGPFNEIVAYLRGLEGSHWQFDWQAFELRTQQYPLSRARIDINTLSLDRNLLGI